MITRYRDIDLHYGCELEQLAPPLREAFVQLDADASTRAWIDDCIARPHGAMITAARAVARKVMSDFDANGMLGAHDMRVLGTDQARRLLGAERVGGRLLDVGAGDGRVTAELARLVDSVVATETSSPMVDRLRKHGWTAYETDLVEQELPDDGTFELIALLNVIDRTARPISLLEALLPRLAPEGRLILAVPFPIRPVVYAGPLTVDPEELLPIVDEGWEAQAATLEQMLFAPIGYRVDVLSRVPYLCRGSKRKPVIVLDDAIFVLSAR